MIENKRHTNWNYTQVILYVSESEGPDVVEESRSDDLLSSPSPTEFDEDVVGVGKSPLSRSRSLWFLSQ